MQVRASFALHPETSLRIKLSRDRCTAPVDVTLSQAVAGRLQAYIEASGLVDENYLLPSKRDPNKRMKERAFILAPSARAYAPRLLS